MEPEPIEGIAGASLATPAVHRDDRGFFLEVFREDLLDEHFVQANHSFSERNILRGLHFHRKQSDAWYVLSGRARVVLADLRQPKDRRVAVLEMGDEPAVLYIPPGVAHGFLALTDVHLLYWVTSYYDASDEFSVAWNDPQLAAPWGAGEPVLSERDATAPPLDWREVASILGHPQQGG